MQYVTSVPSGTCVDACAWMSGSTTFTLQVAEVIAGAGSAAHTSPASAAVLADESSSPPQPVHIGTVATTHAKRKKKDRSHIDCRGAATTLMQEQTGICL